MSELAIPLGLMLFVVIGEAVYLHACTKSAVDWADVMFNLNSGHLMLWLFRGLEVASYGAAVNYFGLALLDTWPPALMWLVAFLAWDFCFYWLHRLHHRQRLLWAVHVVHHQGEHFNLSLGVRNSWYSSLASIPFFMPLALVGIPLQVFVTLSIIHYSCQLFNHCALTPKLGWLEKLFVTPAHHRVHHVKDTAYSNKNFGGTLIIWDKLFGTFSDLPDKPYSYGVRGQPPCANPFWASNAPLLKVLGFTVSPQPRGSHLQHAQTAIFTASLLLFCLVIGYVHEYGYGYTNVTWPQVALFVTLVLGSVALGRMSQGQTRYPIGWLLISLGLPLFFLGYLGWSQTHWQLTMSTIALQALWLAFFHRPTALGDLPSVEKPHA